MIPNRRPGSVAVVSIAWALVVLCGVRLLALVRPVGHLLAIELIRAVLVAGGVVLTAWLVLRTKGPDGRSAPLFNPAVLRCAGAGLFLGGVIGTPALAVAAIPEPTDLADVREMVTILLFCGFPLGIILGLFFSLGFARFAAAAFRRSRLGAGDALEGSIVVASGFVGLTGAMSAVLHAIVATFDELGVALLVIAAFGFGVVAKLDLGRAEWLRGVSLGQLPGWSIGPRTDMLVGLPAYADGSDEDGVLELVPAADEGAFRTAPPLRMPVALVDANGESTVVRLRSRAGGYVVYAALLGLLPVVVIGLCSVQNASAPSWNTRPAPIVREQVMTGLTATAGAICARRGSDGRLACWGSRAGVFLGKTQLAYRTPEPDSRLGRIVTFSISADRACAVPERGDRRAVCWTERDREPLAVGPPNVVELAQGGDFTIAVTADGAVWSWGDDPMPGRTEKTPAPVPGLSDIAHVAASNNHVLALGRDGTAYCWGSSMAGECGDKGARTQVSRISGGPFDAVLALSGSSWLRQGSHWRTQGMTFGFGDTTTRDDSAIQYAFSKHEACMLTEGGGVSCTRGGQAPPNRVLAWGALEIAGNDEGYCARTSRELWCWSGYSMALAFLQ